MKQSRFLLLLVLITNSLLSGCAYVYSKSDNVPDKLEQLIKQDEYELALDTIRYVKKDHPQYKQIQNKREAILTATKAFETNVVEQGGRLTKQELWYEADRVYEYGIEKLPNSKKLQFAYQEFLHKRSQHLKQLELKLLVSKGKSLSQSTEARKEIARVFPESPQAKSQLKKHYEEVELTAEGLVDCGEDALKANELVLTNECLSLAKKLNPNAVLKKRIKKLEVAYLNATRANARKNAPSINKLNNALAKAKTSKELLGIQQQVHTIHKDNKNDPKFRKLRLELDKKINKTVAHSIQSGREYYSKGKIRRALRIWQDVKPLDPDNKKLDEYIQRAQRVISKIETLNKQKKPQTINKQDG